MNYENDSRNPYQENKKWKRAGSESQRAHQEHGERRARRDDRRPFERDDRRSFGDRPREERGGDRREERRPFERSEGRSFDRGERRPFDRKPGGRSFGGDRRPAPRFGRGAPRKDWGDRRSSAPRGEWSERKAETREERKPRNIPLKVLRLNERVVLPSYASKGSSGFDIRAFVSDDNGSASSIVLKARSRIKISTGLKFVIPEAYELQIRPRSGLAFKNGISLTNTPGTIDSDYRGELQILLVNLSDEDFQIQDGDRIAQAVLAPVLTATFTEIEEMPEESDNTRGEGGFGSTGRR